MIAATTHHSSESCFMHSAHAGRNSRFASVDPSRDRFRVNSLIDGYVMNGFV